MARHPKVFTPAVRGDGQGGGDRRRAGELAGAGRRPAGEGRLAAQTDPLRDGLPDTRDQLRAGGPGRDGRLRDSRLRRRVQELRRRTADDHSDIRRRLKRRHPCVVRDHPRRDRARLLLPEVEAFELGTQAVGSLQAARPDEDRDDRPGGRPGALVAHPRLADRSRRSAAAGTGDRRQDRRQHRDRGGDGRGDRLGEARRHALRAARARPRSSPPWSTRW